MNGMTRPLATAVLLAWASDGWSAGPEPSGAHLQEGKEVLVIDLVPGAMGKVVFKHADHVRNRRHPDGRPLRCKDCHHDLPTEAPAAASEVERCVACHVPVGPRVEEVEGAAKVARPMATLKPNGAVDLRSVLMHAFCRDCHRRSRDGSKMLEGCKFCHEHGVTSEVIHGESQPAGR